MTSSQSDLLNRSGCPRTATHAVSWDDEGDEFLSSQSLALNRALKGGFPFGRIMEIFGPYDSGKTTIGLAATANAQKRRLRSAYLDTEYKLSRSSIKRAGVDSNGILFMQISEATETVEILLQLALSGTFGLVVVDTLAALVPGWEIEDNPGSFSGKVEALFERSLPRIAAAASKTNTCVILLNQVRTNHDEPFGNPLTTIGGHVLRHTCSVRVELKRHRPLKRPNGGVFGRTTKAIVVKNSAAPPWGTAIVPLTHDRGVDSLLEAALFAKQLQVVNSQRPYFEFEGVALGNTYLDAYEYLMKYPDMTARFLACAADRFRQLPFTTGMEDLLL